MKIFNETGQEIQETEIDYELGYTVPDKKFIKHHDATPEIPAIQHYEVSCFWFKDGTSLNVSELGNKDPHVKVIDEKRGIFEYVDQGENQTAFGTDMSIVIDKPAIPAVDAWDEYEDILLYKKYTPEELTERKKQKEKAEKQQRFMEEGPDILKATTQTTNENTTSIDDINLLIADLIGA